MVGDLDVAGNQVAGTTGASTRELMGRMGRISVDAGLIYQHQTASPDRAIADSLGALVAALRAEDSEGPGHVEGTATG